MHRWAIVSTTPLAQRPWRHHWPRAARGIRSPPCVDRVSRASRKNASTASVLACAAAARNPARGRCASGALRLMRTAADNSRWVGIQVAELLGEGALGFLGGDLFECSPQISQPPADSARRQIAAQTIQAARRWPPAPAPIASAATAAALARPESGHPSQRGQCQRPACLRIRIRRHTEIQEQRRPRTRRCSNFRQRPPVEHRLTAACSQHQRAHLGGASRNSSNCMARPPTVAANSSADCRVRLTTRSGMPARCRIIPQRLVIGETPTSATVAGLPLKWRMIRSAARSASEGVRTLASSGAHG